MYNNKFKYDVKFTAEDKKVFFGGGLLPFHPFENSSLRYSLCYSQHVLRKYPKKKMVIFILEQRKTYPELTANHWTLNIA